MEVGIGGGAPAPPPFTTPTAPSAGGRAGLAEGLEDVHVGEPQPRHGPRLQAPQVGRGTTRMMARMMQRIGRAGQRFAESL